MNVLSQVQRQRNRFEAADRKHVEQYRNFLVNHKKHVQEYRKFIVNRKWETGCHYDLEWPYLTIPDMIKDKIINHYLKIQ